MNVYLGANAKAQAICFALCFAIGLAGGVFALLFLRKANPLERALTDIFGSSLITGAFFCAFYFVMQGEPTLYGIAAFILGVALVPLCVRKNAQNLTEKAGKQKEEHSIGQAKSSNRSNCANGRTKRRKT